jgi:hypothetical protein
MINKLWMKWKDIRANDPVKARLVRVLCLVGVIVLPFVFECFHAGFSAAVAMGLILALMGFGVLAAIAATNYLFGWLAHYVFTGEFADVDDWLDSTILDEWETYQNKQVRAARSKVTQTIIGGSNNIQSVGDVHIHQPKKNLDNGPDWLNKT